MVRRTGLTAVLTSHDQHIHARGGHHRGPHAPAAARGAAVPSVARAGSAAPSRAGPGNRLLRESGWLRNRGGSRQRAAWIPPWRPSAAARGRVRRRCRPAPVGCCCPRRRRSDGRLDTSSSPRRGSPRSPDATFTTRVVRGAHGRASSWSQQPPSEPADSEPARFPGQHGRRADRPATTGPSAASRGGSMRAR